MIKAVNLDIADFVILETIVYSSMLFKLYIRVFNFYTKTFSLWSRLDKFPLHKFLRMCQTKSFEEFSFCFRLSISFEISSILLIPDSNSTTWNSINLSLRTFPINDKLMKNDSINCSSIWLDFKLCDSIWLKICPINESNVE